MAVAADSIRHLTRAYLGARVYQGLLFCFVLVHNVSAMLRDVGYRNPRLQLWIMLATIVSVGTVGTYFRWRFGRAEPPRKSLSAQVVRGTAFALFLMVVPLIVLVAGETATRHLFTRDFIWLLLSSGTLASLAMSRRERMGWLLPVLAILGLVGTLVVPSLQPYRALGHGGMATALVVMAVQLHLFLERGFRHAQI
jgi:uncharacterized membrane protein YeaQ/YmgE (transglycosylase-associated protein family)